MIDLCIMGAITILTFSVVYFLIFISLKLNLMAANLDYIAQCVEYNLEMDKADDRKAKANTGQIGI